MKDQSFLKLGSLGSLALHIRVKGNMVTGEASRHVHQQESYLFAQNVLCKFERYRNCGHRFNRSSTFGSQCCV